MRRKYLAVGIILFGIFLMGMVYAYNPHSYASFVSSQYSSPSFSTYYGSNVGTYWPILNNPDECKDRQDIMLLRVVTCQPAVVRSDLLAEQNVPVFCQIDALKINPLIDVKDIRNIRFSGKYPSLVSGVGFHPARAALRTNNELLGDPLLNNIGYAVVVLKRQANESALPDSVEIKLQAQLDYEAGNVFGVGRAEFLLKEQSDEEFSDESNQQTFWNGRYKIRLRDVDEAGNAAAVVIYSGDRIVGSTRVGRGVTSNPIYLPGSYCQASLKAEFSGFENDRVTARIEIGNGQSYDVFDVYEGSYFLDGKCRVNKIVINSSALGTNVGYVTARCPSGEIILSINNITRGDVPKDAVYSVDTLIALNNSFYSYKRTAEDFPSEVDSSDKRFYGAKSLEMAIVLAFDAGRQSEEIGLIKIYLEKYPDSELSAGYRKKLENLGSFDYAKASKSINLDGRFRSISLLEIRSPLKKSTARISYGGSIIDVSEGQRINLTEYGGDKGLGSSLRIVEVGSEFVRIETNCRDYLNRNRAGTNENINLRYGQNALTTGNGASLCGKVLVLSKTETQKIAKIKLTPSARNTETNTNLTIKIGIEKRAIQLNPAKTAEKVKNINETIQKWESINKNIGTLVSGLKGACFATAGILTVKNFLGGISGTALARQKVMPSWTEYCKDRVYGTKDGKRYVSMDACFLAKSAEINKDVAYERSVIDGTNAKLKEIQADYTKSSGLFGKNVDTKASAKALALEVKRRYGDRVIQTKEGPKNVSEVLNEQAIENEWISYSEIRDIYTNLQADANSGFSPVMQNSIKKNLVESADRIQSNSASYQDYLNGQKATSNGLPKETIVAGVVGGTYADVVPINSNSVLKISPSSSLGDTITPLNEDPNCRYISKIRVESRLSEKNVGESLEPSKSYLLCLKKSGDNAYSIEKAFKVTNNPDGTVVIDEEVSARTASNAFGTIKSTKNMDYVHPIKNPQVRYYETEPYKGMPAVVPFDVNQGWYAATRQTLPAFGGIGAFDSSGRVVSFYLCNVMENGQVDFESGNFGDDVCRQYSLNTGQPVSFPGLSDSQSKALVDKAVTVIEQAARQYNSRSKVVSINGKDIPLGRPMSNQPETKCQDFMSPKECNLLFNVCDPVICPPTRCNFGGKYNVPDVIQSGIVGSALLCLPNIREGIYAPVCLSGIHAGIESYVSILKAHRDCLQENLNSGQMIGICDQIYSVYSCEFFWNQFAPLMNVLIPKTFELFMGQGTRGGGEYMTVAGAWKNAENSIQYMTQIYGVNAFKAFRMRNAEEAGGEFCKAFISTSVPTSLKSLTQPDSPPQFTAYFDAIKFSDATVPATSQYKVFYHIYAGKDSGVSYRVYLKNAPTSSYYISNPYITVATGFIGKGQTISQARDFTAPEGYKDLCVNINGEEKCGFKQVSTDFAVNYLRDAVVKEQITGTNIASERECISGSVNAAALLNPNIQSAAQEAASPDIYRRGIIRICASENPGKSTDPTRFVKVGNCGSESMGCWLDKKSVDNAITDNNLGVKNVTLSELQKIQVDNLLKENKIFDNGTAKSALDEMDGKLNALSKSGAINEDDRESAKAIISRLRLLLGIGSGSEPVLFWNQDKARAWFIIGKVYDKVARGLISTDKTDSQVVYSFIIKDKNDNAFYLRYLKGWQFSVDELEGWYSVDYENISVLGEAGDFLSEFVSLSYEDGKKLIQQKYMGSNYSSDLGGSVSSSDVPEVFSVVKAPLKPIYFKYDGGWMWSLSEKGWKYAREGLTSGETSSLAKDYRNIVGQIAKMDFESGKKVLCGSSVEEIIRTSTPGEAIDCDI